LLISGASNVRYLSGYAGSNGLLLAVQASRCCSPIPATKFIGEGNGMQDRDRAAGPTSGGGREMDQRRRIRRLGFEAHM